MSHWNKIKEAWTRIVQNPQTKVFLASPVVKIMGINAAMFLLWRLKGVSETFLVKNFSFDRFNIRENRFYTMVTYAFSHFGFFHFFFNMLIVGTFGRSLKMQFGNKVIWWLYILGALCGGITMQLGMPYTPMVIPQVGADASISAMITFYGLFNLHSSVLLFVFPVKMWVLLSMMSVYCLFEPSKKNMGGMLAGLMVYQLFKIRVI